MLVAYLDDSGSEPNSKGQVFVIAGFLATPEKWRSFAAAWDKALKRSPGITHWKSSADLGQLTQAQSLQKANELALVIKGHDPCAVDFRMSWNAFSKAESEFPQVGKHLKAYEMLFHGILASITHYLESKGIPDKIEFVFDSQGTVGTDAIESYNKVKGWLRISSVGRIARLRFGVP
jgi:hypothetical protein